MSEPKGPALLVAVTHAVRAALRARSVAPANGSGPLYWPLVAKVMAHLIGETADRNRWRNRYDRAVANLSEEAVAAMVASVAPETYREAVRAVVDAGEAPAGAPVSTPVEEGVPAALIEFPDLKYRADPGWGMDFLDVVSEIQDTMRSLDTQQNAAHAVINTDLPVGVVFPGDFHLGGRGTNHRLLKRDMLMWKALGDAVKVIGMGDYSEQFSGSLARIGLHQHVLTTDMQLEVVMDVFCNALKEQWLVFLEGNHDGWAGAELSRYVMRMAQRCNVPFLGKGGELFLTVGQVQYKLALWHRYPGASALNKGNNQRRVRIDHQGTDVVALAHLHNVYVEYTGTGAQNHVSLRCGAYKEIDEHSRDVAGNVIADTRVPMVVFNPHERDLLFYEDYKKGLETLLRLRWEWKDHPTFKVGPDRLRQLLGI